MKEETGRLTTTGEDERGRKGAALRGCPVSGVCHALETTAAIVLHLH